MIKRKCPLCNQTVTEELYEKITGIWQVRRDQEKALKKREQELIKQQISAKKELLAEKRKLQADQKDSIEKKVALQTKRFSAELNKIKTERDKIKAQTAQRIEAAIKSAERKARAAINLELKKKFEESTKKAVAAATKKTEKESRLVNFRLESTRKQMTTLVSQNTKQQLRITNLEKQLKNKTTPQLEGFLNEIELMGALKKEFPGDKFVNTGKGGDILHDIILDGKTIGLITYECKRVSHWSNDHIDQTAKAKIQRKADYAILVTNVEKKGTGGFFIEKGVLVINPGGILTLALILRDRIVDITQMKLTKAQRDEAIENTIKYLRGAEFKNSLDVAIRKTVEMYEDLKKESKDHVKMWVKRYDSLKTVYAHTAQVQMKTAALITGQVEDVGKEIEIKPFPALPEINNE